MKVELLKQGVHDVSNALEEVSAIMACVGERHDDRTSCTFTKVLHNITYNASPSHTLAVSWFFHLCMLRRPATDPCIP